MISYQSWEIRGAGSPPTRSASGSRARSAMTLFESMADDSDEGCGIVFASFARFADGGLSSCLSWRQPGSGLPACSTAAPRSAENVIGGGALGAAMYIGGKGVEGLEVGWTGAAMRVKIKGSLM